MRTPTAFSNTRRSSTYRSLGAWRRGAGQRFYIPYYRIDTLADSLILTVHFSSFTGSVAGRGLMPGTST